jgi:hypothetical protein
MLCSLPVPILLDIVIIETGARGGGWRARPVMFAAELLSQLTGKMQGLLQARWEQPAQRLPEKPHSGQK